MRKAFQRAWRFVRSMRFGLILLVLIAALCLVGSLVEQGRDAAYYEARFGSLAAPMLALGLDHLFSCWYFVGLFGLLCLNLLGCSILRGMGLGRRRRAMLERTSASPIRLILPAEQREAWLKRHGFRACGEGRYLRHAAGLGGSFVTHTGLLMLLVCAGLTLALETSETLSVPVGQTVALGDGSTVRVDSFATRDAEGNVAYEASITLTDARGSESPRVISVNHPTTFGRYKLYQETYATAGVVDVLAPGDAAAERVTLTEPVFLTLDGESGVNYMTLYENVLMDENGQAMPVPASADVPATPMYLVAVMGGEAPQVGLVGVDETLRAGNVLYTFRAPQSYPGIRVKHTAGWCLTLLYVSFGLLLAGLYLCFFHRPTAAALTEDGLALAGGGETAELAEEWQDALKEE